MGNFSPETTGMLSLLDGENANGTWVLNVSDNAGLDTGSMRRFSLIFNSGNGPQGATPSAGSDNADEAAPESKPDSEKKEDGLLTRISNFFFGAS